MNPAEVERFLEPMLSRAGFKLDGIHDAAIYGERPAWAVYYRGQDCKLQICWSARDGGRTSCSRPWMRRTNSVC